MTDERTQAGAENDAALLGAAADERIAEVLLDVGFTKRHQGGHPVYVADALQGVAQQTLSSSSSDYRAGRNAAAQVVRDLNLADFKD